MLTLVFTWFGDLARKLLHSRQEVLRVHPHEIEVRIVCNRVWSMVPMEGEIYWKTSGIDDAKGLIVWLPAISFGQRQRLSIRPKVPPRP